VSAARVGVADPAVDVDGLGSGGGLVSWAVARDTTAARVGVAAASLTGADTDALSGMLGCGWFMAAHS
jgi:hypothetical protein